MKIFSWLIFIAIYPFLQHKKLINLMRHKWNSSFFVYFCFFSLFLFWSRGFYCFGGNEKNIFLALCAIIGLKAVKAPPPISLFLLYLFFTFISVIVIFFLMKFKLFGYQLFINVQVEMVVDFPCIAYCLTHSIVYRKWALEVGRSESCNIWEENLFFGKA